MENPISTEIIRATVVLALPTYGVAIVTPTEAIAKDSPNLHIAYIGANSTYYGGSIKSIPPAGTTVLCIPDVESDFALNIVAVENFNPVTPEIGNGNRTNAISATVPQTSQDCLIGLANHIMEKYPALKTDVQNKGALFSLDAEGGDLDVSDSQGYSGIRVSRLSATLHGSQMAYVEASEPENKLYMQSVNYENNTLLTEHAITPEYEVQNTAISLPEALGTAYTAEKTNAPEEDATQDTNAITGINLKAAGETKTGDKVYGELERKDKKYPLFRLSTMRGRAVDGEQELVLGTPDENGNPPILSKYKRSTDGGIETASACRICSVKTPAIHGVQQADYTGKRELKTENDKEDPRLRAAFADNAEHSYPDGRSNWDTCWDKWFFMTHTNTPMSETLLQEMSECGLTPSVLADGFSPSAEPGGITHSAEYNEADSTIGYLGSAVSEEAEKVPLSGTTSIISQEANGDIVLSDGYGSEIRMSKGNIFISSALDTYIMPGRDLITMAGGEQSYTSRKGCSIKAGTTFHAAAEKDMKLCGGLGGDTSSVTVENSAGNVDVFTRKGTTAIGGENIFIGRRSPGARPKDAAERKGVTENDVVSESGSIVIDAGENGSIGATANSIDILSRNGLTAAVCDYTDKGDDGVVRGTILQATQQTIDLLSDNARMSGTVLLSNTSADLTMRIPEKGGKSHSEVRIKGGDAENSTQTLRLNVKGGINCDNSLVNTTAIVKGTLIGKNIGCVSGQVGTVSLTDKDGEIAQMWQKIDAPNIIVQQAYLAGLVAGMQANQGCLVDRLWKAAFNWPDTKPPYVDEKLALQPFRWQLWYFLDKDRNPKAPTGLSEIPTWEETPCQSDLTGEGMYPYPGKNWWQDGGISWAYEPEGFDHKYIVNSKD